MKANLEKTAGCTIPVKESPNNGERLLVLTPDSTGTVMMADSQLLESRVPKPGALSSGSDFALLLRAGVRRLAGIIAKLRTAVRFKVPVGYEDEAGFHYGVPHIPKVRVIGHTAFYCAVFSGIVALTSLPAFAVQSVSLAWDPSTSPNVAGYNIYYGPACGTYTNKISVGNVTSATIPGLTEGACNYFVVRAYDALGLESLPSNEVSYDVPDQFILAIKSIQTNGSPTSVTITATGATPADWVLESSPDFKTWTTVTEGTDPKVNVSLAATGTPALFFRLKDNE